MKSLTEDFLRIEGVSKEFDGTNVLENITITIKEGESLGILGRSGAGKSVLIYMLRGMKDYEPTQGKIIYIVSTCPHCLWVDLPSRKGQACPRCKSALELKEIDFWNPKNSEFFEPIRRRIAIMFQRTFSLYGDFSSLENVMESLRWAGCKDENVIVAKSLELLKTVNLTHRLTHPARDLSGGEKQRVVLARQLATDLLLLLADEPTGTLDPQNAMVIYSVLDQHIRKRGKTMLVTSHIPEAIEKLTDRAIWLDQGKIVLEGNSKEVVEKVLRKTKPIREKEKEKVGDDIIRLLNVTKHFLSIERGIVRAVDGVTLNIREKEIFGIIGLSGMGKTTIAKIMAGITNPTSGEVSVKIGDEWIDLRNPGPLGKGRATQYIKLLHQEYALYNYRTVLENLTESIELELPSEFAEIKVYHVLKSVGFNESDIKKILNKYPDEMSEGERHRVALAQVMAKEPRIVILDEPSGTMDPLTKAEVAKAIMQTRSELETTIVIISHDMDFVCSTCDRAALVCDGKIEKIGTPSEIVKQITA